jgi:ribosomal protein S25
MLCRTPAHKSFISKFKRFSIRKEVKRKMERRFMQAEDVAEELSVSVSYAYKIIRQLNAELKEKGFITISGRVSREYFNKRVYGSGEEVS